MTDFSRCLAVGEIFDLIKKPLDKEETSAIRNWKLRVMETKGQALNFAYLKIVRPDPGVLVGFLWGSCDPGVLTLVF